MNRACRPRPELGTRAVSEGYLHLRHNPFLPHNNNTSPPIPTTPRHCSFPPTSQHTRSSSLPSTTQSPQPSYSNYVPATTVDWTLPSTRRKHYEALDRDRRGLRRLWKKIVPGLCSRTHRVGFFDNKKEGKESDASSVRRYHLDIHDNDEKEGPGAGSSAGDESSSARPPLGGMRTMSGWSCWGIRRLGELGAGEGQNL